MTWLIYFWNEQLEPADWKYTSKETRFDNCFNTDRISNAKKKVFQYSCNSNQTVWEIKLLTSKEQKKAKGVFTLQIFKHTI